MSTLFLSRKEARMRRYRRRMRSELIQRMGGVCANCGTTENLEFDHPFGREWSPRDISSHMRLKRYEADLAAGNLRLLCAQCNKRLLPETPF